MRTTNERWCYNITSSLIGWVHAQNDPCNEWNMAGLQCLMTLTYSNDLDLRPTLLPSRLSFASCWKVVKTTCMLVQTWQTINNQGKSCTINSGHKSVWQVSQLMHQALFYFISTAFQCLDAKRDITPVLTHWSYVSFALSHQLSIVIYSRLITKASLSCKLHV